MASDDPIDLGEVDPNEIVHLMGVSEAITLREAVRHLQNQNEILRDMATILRDRKKQPSVLNRADIDRLALHPAFDIARATMTIPLGKLNSSNDE
jgi:hypothetical protein